MLFRSEYREPIEWFQVIDRWGTLLGEDGSVSSPLEKAGMVLTGYTLSGPGVMDLDFAFDTGTWTGALSVIGQHPYDFQGLLRGAIQGARLTIPVGIQAEPPTVPDTGATGVLLALAWGGMALTLWRRSRRRRYDGRG